jgi:hypothetical protein
MNDFGILEKLIENLGENVSSHFKMMLTISIFVGLNIVLAVINIFFQFKIKNKEKEINQHNLREVKRIENQENLYTLLEKLTYYDGDAGKLKEYHSILVEINKFLTGKKLYLNKDLIKISQDFTDYFLNVLTDYRKKDYEKETKYLEKYCSKFNND